MCPTKFVRHGPKVAVNCLTLRKSLAPVLVRRETFMTDCAIAQVARIRTQVKSCVICNRRSFPPSTSVSPANSHSSDFSILIIIIWGWYNRSNSCRRTKWTQSHPTPRNWEKQSLPWILYGSSYRSVGRAPDGGVERTHGERWIIWGSYHEVQLIRILKMWKS
jgi:hypothetical protein